MWLNGSEVRLHAESPMKNFFCSMMKYLLFHAKVKFTKCGDNAGMGQCDKYQGLVDLLALLVTANFRDLPSIEELTKVDSVRWVRVLFCYVLDLNKAKTLNLDRNRSDFTNDLMTLEMSVSEIN